MEVELYAANSERVLEASLLCFLFFKDLHI